MPPNQRVTTATTSLTSRPRSTSSIGAPAVPAGSPSSLERSTAAVRAEDERRAVVPRVPVLLAQPVDDRAGGALVLDPGERAQEAGPLDLDLGLAVARDGQVGVAHGAHHSPTSVAADPDDERRDDHDEEDPDEAGAAGDRRTRPDVAAGEVADAPSTRPTFHSTAPCGTKTHSAARLVAQLASRALADASRKL